MRSSQWSSWQELRMLPAYILQLAARGLCSFRKSLSRIRCQRQRYQIGPPMANETQSRGKGKCWQDGHSCSCRQRGHEWFDSNGTNPPSSRALRQPSVPLLSIGNRLSLIKKTEPKLSGGPKSNICIINESVYKSYKKQNSPCKDNRLFICFRLSQSP
jgi:hypothetical protein